MNSALSLLLVAFCIAGCLPDDTLKHRHTDVPDRLEDGWEISTPTAEGMRQGKIDEAYEQLHADDQFYNAIALLVVRHGKLVFETYTRRLSDRDRLHHVQSETKSVTSLLLGILRSREYFPDLDATMSSLWPEPFEDNVDKRNITLRHLLTMRSGIAFDNGDFSVELYIDQPSDPVGYILNKKLYADPGQEFYYRDCDPHLLSALVRQETGATLDEWAKKTLFSDLDIAEYHWGRDPDGISMGAHGLFLKPRDLAKLGQLILKRGEWKGREVVPADWMEMATVRQTETTMTDFHFGFYFWIVPELDAITTWGHGGNFVFVVPDRDLVIVMVSLPDTDDDTVGTLLGEFLPLAKTLVAACD